MSKLTKYSELKHGMRVKCKIEGTQIDDARLSIDENGDVFICQNKIKGVRAENKLGYKYSYSLVCLYDDIENWNEDVTDLESVEETESRKIKSIKFKQINILETDPNAKITDHGKFFAVQKEGSEIPDYWIGKEYVNDIEYEKPTILKRPDGSVISGLEEGQEVVIIRNDGVQYYLAKNYYSYLNNIAQKQGLIFLPEDTHLAEKKAEMLTKRDKIQFEIDRLNAEEEDKSNQKYGIYQFEGSEMEFSEVHIKNGQTEMSEKTAETILKKYTQDELKQYLGIII